ncbi:DUF5005 domain-containing protein [Phytohabitans rumicis]|uniref:Fibronectin type-III domain-containing protein n=1 Tax=Phytohabitans rumicis TaxID=1076125 RepID=A0A6V8KXL5_9ACTN|nr:DUF5005 domain-containing protein [Phytohabitans rumicis]GFJ87428.1 hypothetical protein Prum_010700 [Phytohabitans rumicis]
MPYDVPLWTWRAWLRAMLAAAVLLAATIVVSFTSASRAVAAVPAGGMTPAAVTGMFAAYGDAGGHWTGGDSTASVLLPDGRVVWLFSDTFLGTVNADGSRPANTPMVNNTIVVQEDTSLVATLHGGTATAPTALVVPQQAGEFFWVANGLVDNGQLKVLYNRYRLGPGGSLDFVPTGTSLATFTLPALTLDSVVDLPLGSAIVWGSALLTEGGHTYVYGASSGLANLKFGHVARVPVGNLGGTWEFWNGSAWSPEESAASRLLSGVGTNFAVQKVGSEYVLITQENNLVLDRQFVAYTAASPVGPFAGPTVLFSAPEAVPGNDVVVYHARLHQELARSGKLLLSYDVNTLDNADNYADARLYRPRFREIDWPPTQPNPSTLPAAPTGLTATSSTTGTVNLSWNAVAGATEYRVYRRYVTGGQTHFARHSVPVTGTSAQFGELVRGHEYQFTITAANASGESPRPSAATVTPTPPTDIDLIHLANTPESVANKYFVTFKDTPAVQATGVERFAQEITQQYGATLGYLYPLTLNGFSMVVSQEVAITLAAHPDVLDVEQVQTVNIAADGGSQTNPAWGLDRIDQENLPLDRIYRYPNSADGVSIYVVDTGVRATHAQFGGRVAQGYNAFNGGTMTDDCSGHGTGVASLAGGTYLGVARNVRIVPVKVFDCMTRSGDVQAAGIEWVARTATRPAVVNLSLAGIKQARPTKVDRAVLKLLGRGLTVVAAAGNDDGADACNSFPAYLSKTSALITVGGTTENDQRTGSSNQGPCVSIYAPGAAVPAATDQSDTSVAAKTGTSYAAPHVAGAAAMVLAAHPGYGPEQVRAALVDAATPDVLSDVDTSNRLLFIEQVPDQAPTNLVATPNPDGTVGLQWQPVTTPHVEYLVSSRDVTLGQSEFERWADPVDATTAVARDLVEGHTYEFKVAAATSMGVGPESNVASAVAHTAPPGPPTQLTAASNNDGTIALSWVTPGPNVWFNVYQRDITAGETEPTKLPLPVTECCALTAAFLHHGHDYEFTVTATNVGGESPPSNPATARSVYPPPGVPTNLTAVAGDSQVQLTWAAPSPDVWFNVYQRDVTLGETEFTKLPLPVTECCALTATYLANQHTYEFKVTATNVVGESGPSNLVQATPLPPLPAKVTGLTATANNDGSIALSWSAPPGGDFWYDVYQRDVTAGETEFTKLPLPVTQCCALTASYLVHSHVYQFKVGATNGRAGPLSDPAQATAHYSPPPAPTNLRASTAGSKAVHLNWDAGPNLIFWVYIRDVTAGQTTFTKSFTSVNTSAYTWTDLWPTHLYEFKVTAQNPGGEGPASNVVQITAVDVLPNPPTGLSATAGDGQAVLSWTASTTTPVTYTVYQQDTTIGQSWQKLPTPASCCTMTAQFLTNAHTYRFKVVAANTAGESAPTNIVTVKPMPPLPQAPSGLTAAAGDGQVTLSWSASSTPNVWYLVELRAKGSPWRQLQYPVTTCCSYVVNLLDNGTTYDFRVRATNLSGQSTPSNVASARPMPPFPQPPSNLTATAGDGQVTLRWSASSTPNVWYLVELRAKGSPWRQLQYPVTTCCTYTVKLLDNGTTYDFRVRATNLSGESAPSNVATARPMPPLPQSPVNLTATPIRKGSTKGARLIWVPSPTPPVLYNIYVRDPSTGNEWVKLLYPVAATTFDYYPIRPVTTYEFRVTATNISGESGSTNVVAFRVPYDIVVEAKITCTPHYVPIPPVGYEVGWVDIALDAWGIGPEPYTPFTASLLLYSDGQLWSRTDLPSEETRRDGRWWIDTRFKEGLKDHNYDLVVIATSSMGTTWGIAHDECYV